MPKTSKITSPNNTDSFDTFPDLIAFDLDYTLWPFWVDTHISGGPFKLQSSGNVTDRGGFEVSLYKDVASILEFVRCYFPSTKMALASRTPEPEWAAGIIEKLEIMPDLVKVNLLKEKFGLTESQLEPSAVKKPFKEYFSSMQLYPGNKLPHFRGIQKDTYIAYSDMVFYDDEPRNIKDVGSLGVFSVLVKNGLTIPLFLESISQFVSKK